MRTLANFNRLRGRYRFYLGSKDGGRCLRLDDLQLLLLHAIGGSGVPSGNQKMPEKKYRALAALDFGGGFTQIASEPAFDERAGNTRTISCWVGINRSFMYSHFGCRSKQVRSPDPTRRVKLVDLHGRVPHHLNRPTSCHLPHSFPPPSPKHYASRHLYQRWS